MVTVGITGGIGSGKSTVCEIWSNLGAYILNADDLAKQVMVSDPEVKEQLVKAFGEASFQEDGALNRQHLAVEAFEKGRVKELNAIVHPKLPDAAAQKMREAKQAGHKVFVYEAALLLENIEPGDLDYLVLVLADEEHRIERVQQRDNASAVAIKQRMDKQRNFEKVTDKVDYVIRNNGTLEELKKKAELIYQNFLS
jgi:dephospho-CoA kinase